MASELAQTAFGECAPSHDRGTVTQAILALGRQDVDPEGLSAPFGIAILAASSDHLVVEVCEDFGPIRVGQEIGFELNYSALLRAMTSPFVSQVVFEDGNGGKLKDHIPSRRSSEL